MNLLCALILVAGPGAVVPFVRPAPVDDNALWDESQLIKNALAGQRSAQHTLYVRHYARVQARISRLLGRSSEVDDILQDTFVAAFRDLGQLADGTRFGNWVCGIAVHQVHRRLRRRKLLQRLGFEQATELTLCQTIDPTASPETRLLLKQLDQVLSTLAPRQRVAWMLRYVEGCSLDEVASHCRVSLATAKRHIAQAESHLNAQLFDGKPQ
jgi:RNA polymerase sigma-70 factor, ECF subfamily